MFSTIGRVLVGASLLAVAGSGWAQSTASATGQARAKVVAPISVQEDETMNFGIVVASATGGTIKLEPQALTLTGVTRSTKSSNFEPGRFTVYGEAAYTYAITLPTSSVYLSSCENSMELKSFTSHNDEFYEKGVLNGSGAGAFRVGATLVVPSGTAVGEYSGTYSVTVTYN